MRTITPICVAVLLFGASTTLAEEHPPAPPQTEWTTLAAAETSSDEIAEEPGAQEAAESVEAQAPVEEPPILGTVVVSAQRLPGVAQELNRIPTNVTIITYEEIERSTARTVPELLRNEAGFVVYDNVGNGVQNVVDLRGFYQGNATTVLVDGVRVNEPDNNFATFELLPSLKDIERIEIVRGGASTIYGEGAFAGVINIITKKGVSDTPSVTLSTSYGSFYTQMHHVTGSGRLNGFNYYAGFARNLSDGFRDNGGYEESKLLLKLGYDFSEESDIAFSYSYVDNNFEAPGALTREELHESRSQTPFNSVDEGETDLHLFSVSYHLNFLDDFDLRLNGFVRDIEDELLTTGRWGGGFLYDSDNTSPGFTAQLRHDREIWGHRNVLTVGFEYTKNDFGARGFITDAQGENPTPYNKTETEEDVYGVFLEDSFDITDKLVVTAGIRYDENKFDFEDKMDPTLSDKERFDEVSPKVGLIYNATDSLSLYANYSEGFLSPSVEQLFALGGYGSNPNLDPAVSENYEVGLRTRCRDWFEAQLNYFFMDIDGEILYDPTVGFFGTNVNRDTERDGVELSVTGDIGERASWFANYTYTDATFESGIYDGKTVQLVPENRFSAGVDIRLSDQFTFSFDGLFVDEQVLDGDEANQYDKLDDYTVFNAKLTFVQGDFTAYLAARNIFDLEYETRGIMGFLGAGPYFTPAPPASITVGASYTF